MYKQTQDPNDLVQLRAHPHNLCTVCRLSLPLPHSRPSLKTDLSFLLPIPEKSMNSLHHMVLESCSQLYRSNFHLKAKSYLRRKMPSLR